LLTQLITPIIFAFGPVLVLVIAFVSNNNGSTESIVQMGYLSFIFYGAANSSLTIIFIKPFRDHFYEKLILPWLRPILRLVGLGQNVQNNGNTHQAGSPNAVSAFPVSML
jgi:hypothetical protein